MLDFWRWSESDNHEISLLQEFVLELSLGNPAESETNRRQ